MKNLRLINKVIADLEGCEAYINDVIIYSDKWEEHLRIICEFFERLSTAMLTINLSKSDFGQVQATYLGHIIEQGGVKPLSAQDEAIANFPRPERKKQLIGAFSAWLGTTSGFLLISLMSQNR